jgi:hypothetical protein
LAAGKALVAAPLFSPRAMGETFHALGGLQRLGGQYAKPTLGGLRQLGRIPRVEIDTSTFK